MLRDKIKRTKELVVETKALITTENQNKRDQEFAELVEKHLPPLRKTINSIRNVEKTYPHQWVLPGVKEALAQTKELVANIKYQPKERFGHLLTIIEPLKKEAAHQWSVIVKQQHLETKKTLLLMKKIQKDSAVYEQLIQLLDNFENLWPVSQENLNQYASTLQKAKETIALLEASASVQSFLEKMADGKATLSDLNDEVLDWLRTQNLSSHIYMSFK